MLDDVDDYTLTGADSSAFCALIQAQAAVGSAQTSPGQAQFWAFFAAIDSIAYDHYRFITNAKVKGWIDKLFATLLQTQTCYGIDAAGLYVLYSYAQYVGSCFPYSDHPEDPGNCVNGYPTNWGQRGGKAPNIDWGTFKVPNVCPWQSFFCTPLGAGWFPPGSPDPFYAALSQDLVVLNTAVVAAPGQNTSTVANVTGYGPGHTDCPQGGTSPDLASVQQFEQSRFDPTNWTDSDKFVQNLSGTGLWEQQSAAVTALLEPATLSGDDYFFLLHLLVALGTSTASDQRLAQQIVDAVANSQEYPNDTFINQLVYLTLMYLADPLGKFAWTNAQLQAQMDLMAGVITSRDPASQAIHTSLLQHQRVLQTDASYPMQDPYSPAIGFTERKTDTLAALDAARTGLKP
jgi:hypothetical protein